MSDPMRFYYQGQVQVVDDVAPGFAMLLWSLYLKKEQKTGAPWRKEIDETLSGNLCRCTGYHPIIDAARRMGELPEVILDQAALAAAAIWKCAPSTLPAQC